MLDADPLKLVGETRIGPLVTRLAVQAGHALYRAAGGYLLMDLQDATQPRAQGYVPTLSPYAASGVLTGDSVVLQDSGALKRLELTFDNLSE